MNPVNYTLIVIVLIAFVVCCLVFLSAGRKIGIAHGRKIERLEWEGGRAQALVRSRLKQSRAVLGGLVSEQIAPLLPGFPYDPGDCRFVGKPVDIIVFRGMNKKDISEVIFLEVKSGASPTLSPQEKKLRDVIRCGSVKWDEYYVEPSGKYNGSAAIL